MFHVDNNSAVPVMPAVKPVVSAVTSFFTEGGNGVPPTYPGPDWFNIIQSELLAVLAAAGITPDKASNVQLLAAMRALFLDTSQNGADIQDKALFLKNLQLGEAAKRNVGTGANQIPDMNSFTSGSSTTADWYKLPGGLLIQSGINAVGYIGSPFTIGLPVAFSNANYRIVASYDNARANATYGFAMSALPSTASAFTINSSSNASVGPVYAYWIAIGKY